MSTEDDDRIRQLQGALQLLQTGIDRGSHRVEEMHLAIAKKPFGVLRLIPVINLAAGLTETIHDGITHGVHLTIRSASEFALGTAIRALDMAKMDGPADDEPGSMTEAEPELEPDPKPESRPKSAARKKTRS